MILKIHGAVNAPSSRRRRRQLRHHRRSLHRLPDSDGAGEPGSGHARREAPQEPLSFPRLRTARLEHARHPAPNRRRAEADLQVVGDPAASDASSIRSSGIAATWTSSTSIWSATSRLVRGACGSCRRPRSAPVLESPYAGLMPFSEEQAPFFFGREAEREIVTANLMASRLTLLYGPSGVGKSSVINAGVAYHLRRRRAKRRDRQTRIRASCCSARGATIRSRASNARLARNRTPGRRGHVRANGCRTGRGRRRRGADRPRSVRGVLPVPPRRGRRASFAVEFARAVNRRDLRASFLVSMREDSIAKLDFFKGRIPNLFDNYLRIDRLDLAQGARGHRQADRPIQPAIGGAWRAVRHRAGAGRGGARPGDEDAGRPRGLGQGARFRRRRGRRASRHRTCSSC